MLRSCNGLHALTIDSSLFGMPPHRILTSKRVHFGILNALYSGMTTTNLSSLLSTLWNMAVEQFGLHESVDAFDAPSECHALVSRGFGRRVHEYIVSCGYVDSDHLARSVGRLGAYKWLCFSPIALALHEASEYEFNCRD